MPLPLWLAERSGASRASGGFRESVASEGAWGSWASRASVCSESSKIWGVLAVSLGSGTR